MSELIRASTEPLKKHEFMALYLLHHNGTDCVGTIDNEAKLAAAIVFECLRLGEFVSSTPSDDGPVYSLTKKGQTAIFTFIIENRHEIENLS